MGGRTPGRLVRCHQRPCTPQLCWAIASPCWAEECRTTEAWRSSAAGWVYGWIPMLDTLVHAGYPPLDTHAHAGYPPLVTQLQPLPQPLAPRQPSTVRVPSCRSLPRHCSSCLGGVTLQPTPLLAHSAPHPHTQAPAACTACRAASASLQSMSGCTTPRHPNHTHFPHPHAPAARTRPPPPRCPASAGCRRLRG